MTTDPLSGSPPKNAGADPITMCETCPFRTPGPDRDELIQQAQGAPTDVWPCHEAQDAGEERPCMGHRAVADQVTQLAARLQVLTPEKKLAEELGLPRAQLAKLRASVMIEGEHWTKQGNLVQWTLIGIEALRAQLGKKDGGADPDALAEALAAPARAELKPVILLVARIVSNTRVVLAREEGPDGKAKGDVVTVRGLRDSRLLHKGQRIQATADPQGPVWNWWGPHPKRRGQILVPKFDGAGKPVSAGARTPGGGR